MSQNDVLPLELIRVEPIPSHSHPTLPLKLCPNTFHSHLLALRRLLEGFVDAACGKRRKKTRMSEQGGGKDEADVGSGSMQLKLGSCRKAATTTIITEA